MELKNAFTICLISLFSATLVVLIARSLDSQAASQLEPQLAQIVEQLRALRSQGGSEFVAGSAGAADTPRDGLVVYYFHGDIRCPTCRAIESQTKEVIETDFADQLDNKQITWKILNYDKPESADLVSQFDVHMANVVLVRLEDGQVQNWKRLDQVWALHGDKAEFAAFMQAEIAQMLQSTASPSSSLDESSVLHHPVPDELPQPSVSDPVATDLPLPE